MCVQVRGKLIKLVGHCGVQEAERLHEKLTRCRNDAKLDLSNCDYLHSAVLQVLLDQPRALKRPPRDPILLRWLQPPLEQAWAEAGSGNDRQLKKNCADADQ